MKRFISKLSLFVVFGLLLMLGTVAEAGNGRCYSSSSFRSGCYSSVRCYSSNYCAPVRSWCNWNPCYTSCYTPCYQPVTQICYQPVTTVCYQPVTTVCYQPVTTVCYQPVTQVCYQPVTTCYAPSYNWQSCYSSCYTPSCYSSCYTPSYSGCNYNFSSFCHSPSFRSSNFHMSSFSSMNKGKR
jgi:hypothetical protein